MEENRKEEVPDSRPGRERWRQKTAPRFHRWCLKRTEEELSKSSHLRFLLTHLRDQGCGFNYFRHVKCEPSGDDRIERNDVFGRFDPKRAELVVYEDKLPQASKKNLRSTLQHMLVNAYDHCRANVDWDNMDHVACAEIRASLLSGECYFSRERRRGEVGWNPYRMCGHAQICAKRRTRESLEALGLSTSEANARIDRVFERCFKDSEPMDRIPPWSVPQMNINSFCNNLNSDFRILHLSMCTHVSAGCQHVQKL